MTTGPAKRTYTKRARAGKEAETRARIVDAVLQEWAIAGPRDTTITAIAARARVQRLTVYRHFEDDGALVRAACAAFAQRHPLPDPAEWAGVKNAPKRLRIALNAVYRYYRDAGDTLVFISRDADKVPGLDSMLREHARYVESVIATLETGWTPRRKGGEFLEVAIRLALRHETWRSLAAEALDDEAAARLMHRMIRALARRAR